jgi:hypothetical protein
LQAIREIAEDIGEGRIGAVAAADAGTDGGAQPAVNSPADPPIPIFACPAHDVEDQVALDMLRNVLDPARWDLKPIDPGTLTAELLDMVAERSPGVVCIGAIPPGGLAHTRYLCKRLRARFPDLKVVVGRWGMRDITTAEPVREAGSDRTTAKLKEATTNSAPATPAGADPMIAELEEAGADFVATTLLETRRHLTSLIPILMHGHDMDWRVRDVAASNGPSALGPRTGRAAERELAAGARTS